MTLKTFNISLSVCLYDNETNQLTGVKAKIKENNTQLFSFILPLALPHKDNPNTVVYRKNGNTSCISISNGDNFEFDGILSIPYKPLTLPDDLTLKMYIADIDCENSMLCLEDLSKGDIYKQKLNVKQLPNNAYQINKQCIEGGRRSTIEYGSAEFEILLTYRQNLRLCNEKINKMDSSAIEDLMHLSGDEIFDQLSEN